jgi:hypothetical protein
MSYPTTRQQDEFLSTLGLDPFRDMVEVTPIVDEDGNPLTALYNFERNGETHIAVYWPETVHDHIT